MGLFDQNPWLNPDTGNLGVDGTAATATPQLPSPEQFASDYKAQRYLNSFLVQKGGGLIPGLLQAITGIPSGEIASAYNAMLPQAQGAETGRLNAAYYDRQNGVAAPGPSPGMQLLPGQDQIPTGAPDSPAGMMAALRGAQGGGAPAAVAAPAQPRMLAPGQGLIATMAGGPQIAAPAFAGRAVPGAGGWGPQQIMQQLRTAMSVPGMSAAIGPAITALDSSIKGGLSLDAGGNIVNTAGALPSATLKANADKGISTAGLNPNDPNAVNARVAGQAGAVSNAQANGTNISDLRFKPAIAGGEANAKVPAAMAEAGNKAYLDALAKFVAPTETRPGNDVVQFSGTGMPKPSDFAPGGVGSLPGTAAPTGAPATLYSNNGEKFNTGKALADETAASRTAADGAYTQSAIYGKMLDTINGAHLGSFSDDRAKWANIINTVSPDLGKAIGAGEKVTQDQVFDKLSTQVAGQATKQLDQTAASALETMRKAYPNRDMTPQALREMIGQLSGLQSYIITKDQARQAYIATKGTASGFLQSDWMKQNTPDKFMDQGIKAANLKAIDPAAARAELVRRGVIPK